MTGYQSNRSVPKCAGRFEFALGFDRFYRFSGETGPDYQNQSAPVGKKTLGVRRCPEARAASYSKGTTPRIQIQWLLKASHRAPWNPSITRSMVRAAWTVPVLQYQTIHVQQCFATVGYYAIGVVPFFVFQRMLRCDLLKLSLNLDSLEHLSNKLLLLKKERALAISPYISLSL